MYKEIDGLIFSDSAVKNGDTGGSSSRKSTSRKDTSKLIEKTPIKSKSTMKIKKIPDFPLDQKPFCTYDIDQNTMLGLISRAANFNKKQIQKLDKLAILPQKKINNDLN
jgi:LysM repeat protein